MFETILRKPDVVLIEEKTASVAGSEGCYSLGDVAVETLPERDRLAVYITSQATEVKRVRLRWHFREKLCGQVLGDAWERAYADLEWKNITPWQSLPWYALVNRGRSTVGYGVMVRSGAICSWQIDPAGITLRLDVRNGGEGVRLNGRRLLAANVVSEVYEDMSAFSAAQAFCRVMCRDGIFPKKPVYGSNNWYYAYGRGSAADTLAEADYMAKLTAGVENRPHVVIDDGWQMGRYHQDGSYEDIYNGGPWLPNARYGDMAALASQMSAKNVIPGIWVRLLLDDSAEIPAEWRLPTGALDPSVPQVLDYVRETVNRIGGWGFRLLKHDFSTFDITGRWGCEMPYIVLPPY